MRRRDYQAAQPALYAIRADREARGYVASSTSLHAVPQRERSIPDSDYNTLIAPSRRRIRYVARPAAFPRGVDLARNSPQALGGDIRPAGSADEVLFSAS